ncbi:MAG: FAD-dependent oxidoreductase [Planctomycetes bacterium]|nr:FAD-dependent oxidoreductase [Planctomycetota bacterium]
MEIVIIGNGITGISAAQSLRELQPDWKITIVSGESTYHYSRPSLMYVFMGHMRYQETKPFPDHYWAEQRLDLVRGWVTGIDTRAKQVKLKDGRALPYDKLLLATGSISNKFGWPGQDLPGVQGLYSLMDLKALYENVKRAKRAVIVGGGLIGIELGEMLVSRGIQVTFLVREESYWSNVLPAEESAMVTRLIQAHGFDLRLGSELAEIHAGPDGSVGSVTTKSGERIECELVGLTAGVRPNLAVTEGTAIPTGRGILVNDSLETETPDVYAAGDCAEIKTPGEGRNTLQQVWYTGKLQGRCVAHVMAGEAKTYDPGLWYNSAKFLDLEYQTYGFVTPRPSEGETYLWWEEPTGPRGLRLVVQDGAVTGINAMGLRLRHRVCERWILEKASLDFVLDHLAEAAFDPELCRRFEPEIRFALRGQPVPA